VILASTYSELISFSEYLAIRGLYIVESPHLVDTASSPEFAVTPMKIV
jgi:hypothetical protein